MFPWVLSAVESRKDEREDGLSGVAGRGVRVRDVERFRARLDCSADGMLAYRIEIDVSCEIFRLNVLPKS